MLSYEELTHLPDHHALFVWSCLYSLERTRAMRICEMNMFRIAVAKAEIGSAAYSEECSLHSHRRDHTKDGVRKVPSLDD